MPDTKIDPRAWQALAVVTLGTVFIGFSATATNIAINDIEAGLGATSTQVGWGIAGYFIGTAALLPLGGRLADRLGRRRVFLAGVFVFGLSSLIAGLAPNVWILDLARVAQAAGGAALLPASLSLVLPMFPTERRSGVVGLWASAGPISAGIAPSAAAALIAALDWRSIYWIIAPVAALMWLVGRSTLVEVEVAAPTNRLDVVGAATGTIAVAGVVAAIMQGRVWGYTAPATLAVLVAAIVSGVVFARSTLRHPEPLLNLHLLTSRGVWVTNIGNFAVSIASMSSWLVWPTFLSGVYGYSTLGVGLGITIAPICASTSTIVFSRLSDRFGQIPFIRLGTFLQIAAMTWQFTKLGTEVDYWSDFAPGLLLYGTGWGMSSPLQNSLALASVDERYFGELNGIFNTVRYTAGAIGTAVVFALLTVDTGPESLSHYDATLMFFAISAAVAFVVSWVPLNDRATPQRSGV